MKRCIFSLSGIVFRKKTCLTPDCYDMKIHAHRLLKLKSTNCTILWNMIVFRLSRIRQHNLSSPRLSWQNASRYALSVARYSVYVTYSYIYHCLLPNDMSRIDIFTKRCRHGYIFPGWFFRGYCLWWRVSSHQGRQVMIIKHVHRQWFLYIYGLDLFYISICDITPECKTNT
jgi:hypothetical protein